MALIGAAPLDSDEVRAQKATMAIAAIVVTVLSSVWVGAYLALGLPVSAAIPFAYQLASVVGLVVFSRTRAFRPFRFSQLSMMMALPFVLQWSLGGYGASSAVSLWALIPALGALVFYGASKAIPWFAAFLGLVLAAGLLDPILAQHPATMPDGVRLAFFVLNITGVSVTAYLLLQYFVRAREAALGRSEQLLLNILPAPIASQLKHHAGVIAESHDEVTVLFADVVGFTRFVERTSATRVVSVLDEIFTLFDGLAAAHGLEKIKTIGDAYMVVAGLPEPRPDHAEAAAAMALDMQAGLHRLCESLGVDVAIRVGMDSGPVIAGVIGRRKFSYDLWGDTVNTASRMESHGLPDRIQVTQATYDRLKGQYRFEPRGPIQVKGKGRLHTYLLVGREPDRPASPDA
jgi:adenylate cyclase